MSLSNPLTQFNDWAATWWPGVKTKTLAYVVGLPSVALVVLQMFNDVSWDWKLVVGDYAPYAGMATAVLMYWFRILTDRSVTTVTQPTPATTTTVTPGA